jgi:hypothetical protein
MASKPEFIRRQYEFAAHIRDPEHQPAPHDVEDRRMAIYRELFYNNVESFLSNTFPVLRKIYDDESWHAMVREYFSNHLSRTPLFLEIPREFVNWLREERTPREDDLPFLYELAHYEWAELAISIANDTLDYDGIDGAGDLLDGVPVLSPLAWHLAYHYPVHRIGPNFLPGPADSVSTFLVIYRDAEDEVGFMEINPVTKRLLELLETPNTASGRELLLKIASELSHPQPEVVVSGGAEILANLRKKSIVAGTRRL